MISKAIYRFVILLFIRASIYVNGITIPFEELVKSYDSTARPVILGALIVNVTLQINSLEVDDVRQVIKLTGELQQEWNDIRLRFTGSQTHQRSLGLEGDRGVRIKQHIWLPDLTIAEGFHSSSSIPREFLKINSDGHMVWKQQIFFEFPCAFQLSHYPMRDQFCKFKLQSLGYTIKELEPRWSSEESVYFRDAKVSLRYYIPQIMTSMSTVVAIHSPKRQLQATIQLTCLSGWSVKHTVLPFVAAVATAYLSFFINVTGVTARMIVSSASLVIAFIVHESTYDKTPQSPYTMAIEIFTGTCLAFIWIAVAESVVVNVLSHMRPKGTPVNNHHSMSTEHSDILNTNSTSRGEVAALWLDRCFRVLYPAIFLAFNAVFWIIYH